jgi:hypothetical protein
MSEGTSEASAAKKSKVMVGIYASMLTSMDFKE